MVRDANILNLQGRNKAITKTEFMDGAKRMPFVFDLMRAESFWQDRRKDCKENKQINAFGSQ